MQYRIAIYPLQSLITRSTPENSLAFCHGRTELDKAQKTVTFGKLQV
jgi:hypothetical protein